MKQQGRFEVFGPKQGHPVTVATGLAVHGVLTDVTTSYAEPYLAKGTWDARQSLVADTLNAFFGIDEATERPLVFVDRADGQRAIRSGCEAFGGTLQRRGKMLLGYDVSHPTRARRLEDMLVCGEQFVDIAVASGHAWAENPFRQAGFNPALAAQLRAARIRQARQDGKEPDYATDSGRFFVVPNAGWSVPRTNDPRFHDRVRGALVRYGSPPGFLAGWDFLQDVWSRPAEAIEARFESLWEGAKAAGEDEFGRLALLADKGSDGKLVKLTAQSAEGAERFYRYLEKVRAPMDGGRGIEHYLAGCRDGDPAALRAPLFLNTDGGALTYDTARRRTFAPVMDVAGLKYGGKRPGMHLSRHDRITTAVERIAALQVPAAVKERMLDDLVEFVGWSTGRRMLKVYAASLELIERARRRLRFSDAHSRPTLAIPSLALDDEPDALADLFGDR